MALLLTSFIAGVLTVLAPCVLPLLPIILGGAAQGKGRRNPYVITLSLAVSIVAFTLLLKFSTVFISVPQSVWSTVSGVIILFFGLVSLFPAIWEKISTKLGLQANSDKLMESAAGKAGVGGDVLLGLSFGPVFSSCSPTYFVILATVLPQNFALGTLYLVAYAAGLSLVLLLISILGQKFITKIRWAANPSGWFKKSLGILFILVGIFILTGADKTVQTYLLEKGYFNITNVEYKFLDDNDSDQQADQEQAYIDIVNPSGFVNSEPFTLEEYIGEKVILLDFMTYSCINCIRTFSYLNQWYSDYKEDGLLVVGIHTPEFAFEKDQENVERALSEFGIEFPVVLDNDYATWNAYGNRYWPRKYLIDLEGNIIYDHIGEGAYQETEEKIREALGLAKQKGETTETMTRGARSPETYIGASRNELYNGRSQQVGIQALEAPDTFPRDVLVLDGEWNIQKEYAEPDSQDARVLFKYVGSDVFLVANADTPTDMIIYRDGVPVPQELLGKDARSDQENSAVEVSEDRLYRLIENDDGKEHMLEIRFASQEIELYAFTFGS